MYCWPNPQHHLRMPGRLTTYSHCVIASCKEFLQSVKQCLCPLKLLRLSHPFIINNKHSLSVWHWRKNTEIASFFYWDILVLQFVLVSPVQGSESAVRIHISPASTISLPPPNPHHPSRLPQSTKWSSLCYRAGFHWLSVLLVACTYLSLNLSLPIYPTPISIPFVCALFLPWK